MVYSEAESLELNSAYYQSKILVDAVLDDSQSPDKLHLHGLVPKISYRPELITLYLVNQIYEVKKYTEGTNTPHVVSVGKNARFSFVRKLDGRRSKRLYLCFTPRNKTTGIGYTKTASKKKILSIDTRMKKPERAINTWQHKIYQYMPAVLNACDLEQDMATPFIFKPQWQQNRFITHSPPHKREQLVIIHEFNEGNSALKEIIVNELSNTGLWARISLTSPAFYPDLQCFDPRIDYVVLNQLLEDEPTSIIITGHKKGSQQSEKIVLSETLDVVQYSGAWKIDDIDYYSRIRLELRSQLLSGKQCPVIQGIDIPEILKPENPGPDSKEFTKNCNYIVERVIREVLIKEAVYRTGKLTNLGLSTNLERKEAGDANQPWGSLATGNFISAYVRSKKANPKANLPEFKEVACCWLSINKDNISIKSKKIAASQLGLMKLLGPEAAAQIWEMPDRSHVLIDPAQKRILTHYTNNSTPMITGRHGINIPDLVDRGLLTRGAKPEYNLFPYYNNNAPSADGSQREHVFVMEPAGFKEALIFVSGRQALRNTKKQRRCYWVKVTDFEGQLVDALQQNITEQFLHSFECDILNMNDSSRTSLLIKFARILQEN